MATPISEDRQCTVCGKKQSDSPTPLPECGKCRKQVYCSKACQKNDWKSHKDLCASRVLLNGMEPVHPQFNYMAKMFICSQNLTHGDDPLGLMETEGAQLATRETEIFVDLQVFRGLREEITRSGDERVELMALQALRRDLMVSACDEAIGMMHQVVEVKEKADVNIAILGREKTVAEEEARGLDEKVKELGLETEFGTKQQDVRDRFETKKREMLADIKRKMDL